MRKLTAAAILTATAAVLAFRPSRETIGDLLITLGGHLAYDPPPTRTAADRARGEAELMAVLGDPTHVRPSTRRNGDSPV